MSGRKNDDIPAILERLRPLAEIYVRDFVDRHIILESDGIVFDVHWRERHFMHLCGLDCTVPQRFYRGHRRPVKSEMFFDAVLSGKTKELNIRHAHNPGITKDKITALPLMLRAPESVESLVESQSHDYDYFFGSTLWCVGVTLSEETPIDPDTGTYAPRTVRNISITSRSITKTGTSPRPLTGWRIIPPR